MSTATATRYTPEDLLHMPDGDRYELVDGELVEKVMGVEASLIAGTINGLLNAHAWPAKLGTSVVEPSVIGYPEDPDKMRKPDVAFVRRERFPAGRIPTGYLPFLPDLVVEVVSPNDKSYDISEKVAEYLEAGVEVVWTVYPQEKSVRVDRLRGKPIIYHGDDGITEESVLPGFHCKVSEFFVNPLQ